MTDTLIAGPTDAPAPEGGADASATAPAAQSPAQAPAASPVAAPAVADPAAAKTDQPLDPNIAKPDDKTDDAKKGEIVPKAPAEYTEFTAPEGVTLNPELVGSFKTLAKELDLTQEGAQKVADMGAGIAAKTMETHLAAVRDMQASWLEATKTDKEIGGDKLAESTAVAKAALTEFGSPELKKLLNESGLGSHPEVIRAFAKIGRTIKSDTTIPAGKAASTSSTATRLYNKPTQSSKG